MACGIIDFTVCNSFAVTEEVTELFTTEVGLLELGTELLFVRLKTGRYLDKSVSS